MSVTLEVLRTGPLALVEDLAGPGWRTWASPVPVQPTGAPTHWPTDWSPTRVSTPPSRSPSADSRPGARRGGCGDRGDRSGHRSVGQREAFGTNSIHYAHDGEVISLGAPHSGLRSYLAVRGGIDVARCWAHAVTT